MAMHSSQILAMLNNKTTGVSRGAALYGARQARSYSAQATKAQREFFDAMSNVDVPRSEGYNHPARGALPMRKPGDLTAAELAWLDRLPRDPAAVTFDQAQRLAAMARSFEGTLDHADARALIDAIWRPVETIHDRNAAQVELQNAQAPLASLPAAGTALADAIASEHPDLLPHEVVARASTALEEAHAARQRGHEDRINRAQLRLAELDDATANREALVR